MKKYIAILSILTISLSCKNQLSSEAEVEASTEVASNTYQPKIEIKPISHATFVMIWDGTVFYIDPVGGTEAFLDMPEEDVILVTDVHGDHMSAETIAAIRTDSSVLVVPEAVHNKIKEVVDGVEVIHNNQSTSFDGFKVTAIPMYNLTEERLKFHEKGRGNGYVIEKNGYKVYISGDTEDIPEMRSLKGINKAFICMNLPYTMTVDHAADAVLEFQPLEVYPYHYRGTEGFSDVNKFKDIVNSNSEDISVTLLDWYPERNK